MKTYNENSVKIIIYEGSLAPPIFIKILISKLQQYNLSYVLLGFGKASIANQFNNKTIISLGAKNTALFELLGLIYSLILILIKKPGSFTRIKNLTFPTRDKWRTFFRMFHLHMLIAYINPSIIHIQWVSHLSLFSSLLNQPIGKRPKIIVSLRGRLINVSPHADSALAKLYRDYLPKVDGFHAVSHAIAQEAELWGVTSDKIRVVYSGLELDKIGQFYKTNWRCNTPVYILLVGRFHWIKGYNYALDALRRLLDKGYHFHFTIIAGQPSEEILYQKNSMKLSENINILPNLSHDEVLLNMQHADILLLPSVMEGIANVVLEAMAVGLPVVSSDCGGMSEVIDNEINGLLFQNRNVAHMAEQLEKMINYSPEERERMAILARQRVTEQFGADRLGKEMIALYEEVCKKN